MRKRAIPGKENEMQISENELTIDFLLEERARELCGEQIRWFDLKRTNKLIEYVRLYNMDAKIIFRIIICYVLFHKVNWMLLLIKKNLSKIQDILNRL